MNKIIKGFSKLDRRIQNELYNEYEEGGLERTVFPYKGKLEEGVIFKTDDCIYLVPKSTMGSMKSFLDQFDDDDDDRDNDDEINDEEITDEE